MPTIYTTEQERLILNGYINAYCGNAVSALLVYEWLLCLGQEVRFIWGRRSVATVASVVYILSRYAMLIQYVVAIGTNFPMSDLCLLVNCTTPCLPPFAYSCTASGWTVNVAEILSILSFSAFSALRAYALSSRNLWLTIIIFLLVLPPVSGYIIQCIYRHPVNLPSPSNCIGLDLEPPELILSMDIVGRATTFIAELLVVSLSWWHSYQSYRISRDIKIGQTISGFILYNGSIYFLFLAALYIVDVIFHTASVPVAVATAHGFLIIFYDPMTSILVCRFMLSLRQFDSRIASGTTSGMCSQAQDHATVLRFAAQASDSLPDFLATFANPVHVEESGFGDSDGALMDNEFERWGEIDGVAPLSNSQDVVLPVRGPNKPSNVEGHV